MKKYALAFTLLVASATMAAVPLMASSVPDSPPKQVLAPVAQPAVNHFEKLGLAEEFRLPEMVLREAPELPAPLMAIKLFCPDAFKVGFPVFREGELLFDTSQVYVAKGCGMRANDFASTASAG